MTYKEQLENFNWKHKRQFIINRDLGMCTECGSTEHLNVHHTKYINDGRMAWEYPNSMLTTLCQKCHKKHHDNNGIVITGGAECIPELFERIYRDANSLRILDVIIERKRKENGE